MVTRITALLPYLLISLLCFSAVQALHLVTKRFLATPAILAPMKAVGETIGPVPEATPDPAIIVRRDLFGGGVGLPDESDLVGLHRTSLALVLMGTATGGPSRAIILTKKDKKQEIYRIGDRVDGARIDRILEGKVILTMGDRHEILDMSEAKKYRPRVAVPRVASTASAELQRDRGPVAAIDRHREERARLTPERVRIVLPIRRISSTGK